MGRRSGVRGQAEPVAISLHAGSGIARAARIARLHQRQQAALGVAGHTIGIERQVAVPHALAAGHAAVGAGLAVFGARLVLVAVVDAVVGLAVLGVALAQERVAHAGLRHQIALVGGVEEHLRPKHRAVLGDQLDDARAVLLHRRQPCAEMDIRLRLRAPCR